MNPGNCGLVVQKVGSGVNDMSSKNDPTTYYMSLDK